MIPVRFSHARACFSVQVPLAAAGKEMTANKMAAIKTLLNPMSQKYNIGRT